MTGPKDEKKTLVQDEELETEENLEPEEDSVDPEDAEDVGAEDTDEEESGKEELIPYSKHVEVTSEAVKNRLLRERKTQHRRLETVAGTKLEKDEPEQAVRLWGILKANGELSTAVNTLINQHVTSGKAVTPQSDSREREFAVREARLEIIEKDPSFKKYEDELMDWAEANDFDTSSPRELKAAWRSFKAENANRMAATKALQEGKPSKKAEAAREAKTETGSKAKSNAKVDWMKDSPADILRKKGMKLTTE